MPINPPPPAPGLRHITEGPQSPPTLENVTDAVAYEYEVFHAMGKKNNFSHPHLSGLMQPEDTGITIESLRDARIYEYEVIREHKQDVAGLRQMLVDMQEEIKTMNNSINRIGNSINRIDNNVKDGFNRVAGQLDQPHKRSTEIAVTAAQASPPTERTGPKRVGFASLKKHQGHQVAYKTSSKKYCEAYELTVGAHSNARDYQVALAIHLDCKATV
ncbi:hypothetical protein Clacol_003025 [Clathrus columnatus]|uniref:t-SNARE coiled-coil homology domain-containing protein n=1 Tax=Clathrus columnatus TaxID=1419009 RepID=A0AAV5A2B7_9AGAM|nr:hypothetical protein Clacol_003025 [Clathrus columnatus]